MQVTLIDIALFLSFVGLGLSIISYYFKLNKLWKRRHSKEVTESISVSAFLVDMIIYASYGLNFFLIAVVHGYLNALLGFTFSVIIVLIGSGFWVSSNRHNSFFSRIKQALMLEKEEAGYLLHNLSSKDQAQNVFEVLLHFAQVDGHLAAEEEQLLSDFALRWEIPYAADNAMTYQSSTVQMSHAMHAIQKFLASAPSAVQVAELIDLIKYMIEADSVETPEEQMLGDEVRARLMAYTSEKNITERYRVILAPQTADQENSIIALLKSPKRLTIAGGHGYLVDELYSRTYAVMIRDQYRELGFFAVDFEGHASR